MTYAIIGSGAIGAALAGRFAAQNIPVLIANSRGPASLAPLVAELGQSIRPAELVEALRADIVILAAPFTAAAQILAQGGDFGGRILIDATNAINFADFTPADLGGRLSSQILAQAAPGARLVKGFNTLPAKILAADPKVEGARRTVFLSSDEPAAAAEVGRLAEALGYGQIYLGRLAEGGRLQQFGGALMVHSLLKQ
ncbi:NAD(P)-binding domain-containing protein [Caulobacter sp. CCNWLY153]|uniref:NADP oxidoreductase n=1 Tax=Caulobacter radicis TaxID=2172650 RepID=A0A2T9IYV5_9CAUL|nr:NAD(P)-binding domain-containing protein [Caulobacter radicis]PVM72370.1 NADP oxidoreductase [Caulobacter radicis]